MKKLIKIVLGIFKHKEHLPISGRWKLEARHIHTGELITIEGPNLIVTDGKELLGNMLIDETGYDTGLTYCALGADNTAPAVGQTQLIDEGGGAAMRKTITSKAMASVADVVTVTLTTFFTAGESTLAILEAGIFGHSTAGAAENSGILWSRWLVSFDNSGALYDVTITNILTVG